AACIMRAIWSEAPPAPAATTISTGLVGSHASAWVLPNANAVAAATQAAIVLRIIAVSSVYFSRFNLSQPQDEGRCVEAVAPLLLHVAIELVHERRDRQARAVALRFRHRDAQVLAHPVDREAEVELARVHGLAAVLHLPRLRRTLGDDLEDLLGIEPGLLGEGDAFGKRLHEARDADLVHHLGELPRPALPEQRDRPPIGIHQRPGALEGLLLAAAHHRELAVLGAGLAAGNGRIDEADALLLRGREHLAGDIRR